HRRGGGALLAVGADEIDGAFVAGDVDLADAAVVHVLHELRIDHVLARFQPGGKALEHHHQHGGHHHPEQQVLAKIVHSPSYLTCASLPCASAYTSGERLREAAGLRIATLA